MMFLEYLQDWISENKEIFVKHKLKLEHALNLGNKKVEVGLININNNNVGSFELIADGTCDLLVIDYHTDATLFFQTLNVKDTDELIQTFGFFIERVENL